MTRYEKPVWRMIDDIRNELPLIFAPRDVIAKVKAKYPQVLDQTIRAHVISLSPNHPSSKYHSQPRKMFYYLGGGRFRILDASDPDTLPVETRHLEPKHRSSEMRQDTIDRMQQRVKLLCSRFTYYIDKFDELQQFSGPSKHFHFRTLNRLNHHQKFYEVFDDILFFEYLYATLTSWGMHRMGPRGAKLVDFQTFVDSIRDNRKGIDALHGIRLAELSNRDPPSLANDLWNILKNLKVSASKAKLVANTKALHHLLPNILPPMDREYTLRFFYNHKMIGGRDEEMFRKIYPWMIHIAQSNQAEIHQTIGRGFHTGETKVIDNAIVGFVLTELT